YCGENIILSAAGALDHDEVVELVEKYFRKQKRAVKPSKRVKPRWVPIREVVHKEGEQTHMIVGFDGVSFTSPRRYEAFVLNAWMGGGMSSRLYQTIREKRGLAYTVYSTLTTFTDCGTLSLYVATEGRNVSAIMEAIHHDIRDLKKKKLNSR